MTARTPKATAWDRAAPLYDLQLSLERRALDAALAFADPQPGDRLLDLATGTGALLRRLAARAGPPPRQVIGVDASPRMLARAKARATTSAGWRLLEADAGHLPLADDSQDVVCATYLLHLLAAPARHRVLGEVRRVLSPGGRLVLVTVAPAPRSLTAPAFAAAARRAETSSGLRPFDPRTELQQAGFMLRRVRRTTRGYPSYVVLATLERTS